MKRLFPYFKGSRIQGVLAPLFKMFEATLELIIPLIIASIIDVAIPTKDNTYLIKLSIQLVLLGLVGFAFSVIAQYFAADTAVSFVKRVKNEVYKKIHFISYSQGENLGTSTLITRLTSDMDSVQNGVNLTLRLLLRSPFVVLGACFMAFRVDARAATSFGVAIPLLGVAVLVIMAITMPLYSKVRDALDKVLLSVSENITGTRVIRAFGIEEQEIKEFEEKNDFLTTLELKSGRVFALLNPVTCLIVNTAIAVLIYMGAQRTFLGAITCGAVVALYNYMSQILVELIKFANLTVTITKSVACARRVSSLLEIETTEELEKIIEKSNENYIEFENVSFAYEGARENLFEDVSFSVSEGQTVGIIGSTGSGKTTLVKLLAGMLRATKGNIFVNGKNLNALKSKEIVGNVAFVEQKPMLFSGTVKSNLLMAKSDASEDEMKAALDAAQALTFVMEKQGGLDTTVEQGGKNFSGGQKQRIAVARGLLKKAEILILDDSSSALDSLTDSEMRRAISKLDYKAVFIVSQRTGSIMNADKIILLDDGNAFVGTHKELLETNKTYREIHLSQFEQEGENG